MSALRCIPSLKFRSAAAAVTLAASVIGFVGLSGPAQAASSKGCVGGGFHDLGKAGAFKGAVASPGSRPRRQPPVPADLDGRPAAPLTP